MVEDFCYPVENQIPPEQDKDDNFPGSAPLCSKINLLPAGVQLSCESLTHSDILNCNKRINNRGMGLASEGLWKSMNSLGIVLNSKEKFDPVQKIVDLETRDRKEGRSPKANNTEETKLTGINEGMVKEMWGEDRVDFSYLDAVWASGGILKMWRKDFFKLVFNFIGKGFLGQCVERDGKLIYPVNVYASCDNSIRMITWKKLVECSRKFQQGDWKHWGLKPFKFNNGWIKHPDFGKFVKEEWSKIDVKGRGDFCMVEKLKILKGRLAWWNKTVFGWIDLNIKSAHKELSFLDNTFANFAGTVQDEEVRRRANVVEIFGTTFLRRKVLLRLKSRQSWLVEGDNNTRYFHCSLRGRRSKNNQCSLQYNGRRLEDVTDIKETVFNHFNGFFMEPEQGRPVCDFSNLKSLSLFDSLEIECPFSMEELKEALWECDGNKSLEPDGFSIEFFKSFWLLLKDDLFRFCTDFFSKGKLVKSITSAFIALIPKNLNPQVLSEFRPICLVGCLYKILSKMLAARLKNVLGSLISCNQSAFVPGRNMLDGVLLVNEVIDWAKRNKLSCLLLKVDFDKAYDSLSWNFLRDILVRMGFGKKWMMWMDACIFSSHLSVLVNRSATNDFKVQRGLRQGDPLSPFLFVFAMEGLTYLVRSSVDLGEFKPFKFGIDEGVDILQFADDTVIFEEASTANLWNLKVILRGFELISGLKINFTKSNVMGVNVGNWILDAATNFLACKRGNTPFIFFGIMVGASPRDKKVWTKVLDNFKKRLASWKGRHISIGGRVTLINAVLNAIPSFTFSFYKALIKVLNEIKGIQREGINANDLRWWRDVLSIDTKRDDSDEGFSSCVQCIANNGTNISFWHSFWLGNQLLRVSFPDLFDLSTKKYATVGDIVEWDNGNQCWRLDTLFDSVFYFQALSTAGGVLSTKWQQMLSLVNTVPLDPSSEDSFAWILKQDGIFTVASVAALFDEQKETAWSSYINKRLSIIWKMTIPLKIKIFAWRLFISRLPLKDMLVRRGMAANIIDLNCPFCDGQEETLTHLFFLCQASKNVWEKVFSWIGVSSVFSLEEFMGLDDIQVKVRNSVTRNKVNIIWMATIWSFWLMRNGIVFDNVPFSFESVFNSVMFLSWRWSECSLLLPRSSFYDWYKLPI
ncbi:uncharacterized protein LOC131658988 [Vicia villosa]|uniref:uncharacterized protein LOC131658988 n=1 Tax=Vicia villosa TaxID=3911 RepID=UPI00273CD0D4|nr:uncharacterized protein LOC131658988 [Vicia villosa]